MGFITFCALQRSGKEWSTMKLLKKGVCIALAAALLSAGSGCGKVNNVSEEFKTDGKYPMNTDVTLRVWCSFTPTNQLTSMNDTEFKKYLEEATGVKIKFEHPPVGSADAFRLLMASDDIPDIVITHWRSSAIDEYVDTGAIEDMTPYIEGGVMPNLKKIMDEHEDYKKMTLSPGGRYVYAPMILGDDILRSYRSYCIRKDLLEKAGLESPETIDEWENVLLTFKNMGVKIPLTLSLGYNAAAEGQFTNPFGFMGDFYRDGETVKFGFKEDGYKDYVARMKKWYEMGILDNNFMDASTTRISQIITSGDCGAFYANVGGGLGTYSNAVSKESGIEFDAAKIPVLNKGDKPQFNQTQYRVHGVGATISANSKYKEIAARVIDYGYSEEGQRLWNFGKEGVSYTMEKDENGDLYPKYTELITDPEKRGNGVSMSQALIKYACVGNPVSVQSKYYLLQVNNTPAQRKFLEYANGTDIDDHILPPVFLSEDEEKKVNDLMSPIRTYVDETMVKLIAGKIDFEKGIKEHYETLDKLKIDEVIKIYQDAYDRYKKINE